MINTRTVKINGDVDLTQQSLNEIMKSIKELSVNVPEVFAEIKRRINKMGYNPNNKPELKSVITIEVREVVKSFFTPDIVRWRALTDDNDLVYEFCTLDGALKFIETSLSLSSNDIRIIQTYVYEDATNEQS